MAEILPRHYIFGIIAFTGFIMAVSVMMSEMNPSDTLTDQKDVIAFNNTFNKMDEVQEVVNDLEGRVKDDTDETNFGVFGVLNALINRGWTTLRLLYTSFDFMDDAFYGVTKTFGSVPVWSVVLILAAITIMITFSIFSAIFQRDV